MIELTFTTALMIYLSLALIAVLGIWVYSHYRTRRRTILSCEQDLFVCEYCHCAYLEESIKQLNRCPQCSLFNKHNLYRPLRKKG